MHDRRLTPMDHAVAGLDRLLRTLVPGTVSASEPSPASSVKEPDALDERERAESARLMRVNHSGEVAAQALYQGQAATARLEDVRDAMDQAAEEENDHLAWCEERLRELDGRTSLLNPIWYAGSFAIGAAAGLVGDRWSLGFVSETERQVCAHLDEHLARLPEVDLRSRRVLTRMKADEQRHGETAERAGGAELPGPVRRLMGTMSKVMTRTAYWI